MNKVKISICIPAYNRANVLSNLLDSIFEQGFNDFEVVICEDNSPERLAIRQVVSGYLVNYSDKLKYFENNVNLGYDANLRKLVASSSGEYCLFMGNDDLLAQNALLNIDTIVTKYTGVGVVLRSYAAFLDSPENIVEQFRYFDKELFFPAGEDTVVTFFRRSVVISGLVIHRLSAEQIATSQFDGTLLYQLYLVGMILFKMNGVFTPEIIALYRNGGIPDFGNSESEQGKFVPKSQTADSSLYFISGMLSITDHLEESHGKQTKKRILKDIANYSYPILAIQYDKPLIQFVKYGFGLARIGFWKHRMFYVYFISLLILGKNNVNKLIAYVKLKLGYTPVIGKVYKGES